MYFNVNYVQTYIQVFITKDIATLIQEHEVSNNTLVNDVTYMS